MTNWVCRRDKVVFAVGSPRCPEPSCQARDAFEQGGDESINVYDAVDMTGIKDPGSAWDAVNSVAAVARDELRREGDESVSQTEGVAALLSSTGGAEVAERQGLVPDDPGARDSSTDPVPVELGDGSSTSDTLDSLEGIGESAGSASTKKQRGKDVPSDQAANSG